MGFTTHVNKLKWFSPTSRYDQTFTRQDWFWSQFVMVSSLT